MPRLTRIYTRTGDDGTTALGSGDRVPKTHPRIVAYGSVDELNSLVGVALASGPADRLRGPLAAIQNELFHAGADLCIPEAEKARHPGPRIEQRHITALETLMDDLSADLPPLENFILPGGTSSAAHLHVARSVCRRAERDVLLLAAVEPVGQFVVHYLNRLSDALFVMARYQNRATGAPDVLWNSRA